MAAQRYLSACPHCGGSTSYPVHRERGWPPGDNTELDATLAELSAALMACRAPLTAALAELTPLDVRKGLSATHLRDRPSILRPLGIVINPHSIGQQLCRDALSRLIRAEDHPARHAAAALTGAVTADILSNLSAAERDESLSASVERDPAVHWSPALARVSVWSHGQASVRDARVWLWATEQAWFRPNSVTDEQVLAIASAAKRIVAASPGFRFLDADCAPPRELDQHETATTDRWEAVAREAVPTEKPAAPKCAAYTSEDGELMTATSEDTSTEPSPGGSAQDGAREATAERLHQAAEDLRQALLAAPAVAQSVLDDVKADRAPAVDDLSVLAAVRTAYDTAVALLPNGDSGADVQTGATVRAAINDYIAAANDAPVREGLRQLRTFTAPADNPLLVAVLSEAQQRADTLVAAPIWAAADRTRAAGLAGLHELVDPGTAPERTLVLQQEFAAAHPDLALLAVTAIQLTSDGTVPATDAYIPNAFGGPVCTVTETDSTSQVEEPPGARNQQSAVDHAATQTADHPQFESLSGSAEASEAGTASLSTPTPLVAPVAEAPSMPIPGTRAVSTVPGVPAISDEVAPLSRILQGVADLIGSQRFGMAATIAQAAQWPAAQQSALRIAALSDVIRSESGTVYPTLRSELIELDTAAAADHSASALLIVTSLLRAALVTGEPTTGAILTELAPRVEPNLAAVAEQVGRRTLKGVLLDALPLTVLTDLSGTERSLRAASEAAAKLLRPRTLRYKRATDIAKAWMATNGLLGQPLSIAANDNRFAVNDVATIIRQLADNSHVTRELDTLDRRFKGISGRSLEGAGRQDLVNLVQEVIQPLSEWTKAVLSVRHSGGAHTWSSSEVADMRNEVLTRQDAVLTALLAQSEHGDPILAASSRAAIASLTLTFAVLAGADALAAEEPTAAFALTGELLKVPGAVIDDALGHVTIPVGTTAEQLLTAAQSTWAEAVTMQVKAERFDAAGFLLNTVKADLLPGDQSIGRDTVAMVNTSESEARTELERLREELRIGLRQARTNNEVSEEQAGELNSLLSDTDPVATRDFSAVRRQLMHVSEMLPQYRAEAANRLSERLALLPDVDDKTIDRVTRLIQRGELSTAEELIYFLEIGEPVPRVSKRRDLSRFFPAVPDALPDGLTPEVIAAVRGRAQVPGCDVLDFSRLSPDLAAFAATALDGWRQLAATPPEGRRQISERDLLLPALRVAGLEGTRIRQLDELPRGRDRRFLDVEAITRSGSALVPAFGSKLDGRLRVLLAWGQPSAQLLLSFADQDNSDSSLLVAYLGTMNAQARRELAEQAVANNRTAPVVVLDDAALAYLAAHGNRQIDATMSVLLPFSNTNPYVRQKRGLVAEEMFYGRDAERKSVLDPDGTQLLYGGRGLGKSALLRSAGALFESQGFSNERVSLYLSLDTVGIRAGSAIGPDAIWHALLRDLTDRGVVTLARRQNSRTRPREQVRAGVLGWLGANPHRRLLILLDECDRFFESDAPDFLETTRLKELGLATDGRAKVVFAGLHSVQRYAKTARNGPFSHLAQRPTVIGPLGPQWAANLLTRPLQALGYRFADDDLVNRVLGYCSYQPFLLQMFGSRLVDAMHEQRMAGVAEIEPPYVITRTDVVAVESDVELKADISTAFHDTLHLDPRYNVIANLLAHHAHESGLDARLSDVELREECLDWWDKGFAPLDVEGFRAYLQEMVGLGVLARNNDGRGWHLRSPNVLHMIGSRDDVLTQLVGAATLSVPDEFVALETRAEMNDGRRSPLTAAQIDDVLGDHANQVRVVLGSLATGIGDVAQAVRRAADVGDRFTVPTITKWRQFEEELVAGLPGERRVVLDDLVALAPRDEACLDALTTALEQRPQRPGVTRSAVIVAGPQQMVLWRKVLGDRGRNASLGTVTLRRYDRQTLRVWTRNSEKFSVPERLERLLQVTSGWPALVEQAAQLVASGTDETLALTSIAEKLSSPLAAIEFVDDVGVTADEDLKSAFAAILALVGSDNVTLDDVIAAASTAVDDAETVVACLHALGVFDIDSSGMYRLEPLLVHCWSSRI